MPILSAIFCLTHDGFAFISYRGLVNSGNVLCHRKVCDLYYGNRGIDLIKCAILCLIYKKFASVCYVRFVENINQYSDGANMLGSLI